MASDTEPSKALVPASGNLVPTFASDIASHLASLASIADQSAAHAGGDITGRDKNTTFNYFPPQAQTSKIIEQLMQKLQHEISTDQKVRDTIESLQLFYLRKSDDGVDGLIPKLEKAGRQDETLYALDKKEQFAKLLERWSLYASAQEIFAYLLAKADHRFSIDVRPKISNSTTDEINRLISINIIDPLIEECGVGVFNLNHSIAMGMLYWLAEMCFIRWHK